MTKEDSETECPGCRTLVNTRHCETRTCTWVRCTRCLIIMDPRKGRSIKRRSREGQ